MIWKLSLRKSSIHESAVQLWNAVSAIFGFYSNLSFFGVALLEQSSITSVLFLLLLWKLHDECTSPDTFHQFNAVETNFREVFEVRHAFKLVEKSIHEYSQMAELVWSEHILQGSQLFCQSQLVLLQVFFCLFFNSKFGAVPGTVCRITQAELIHNLLGLIYNSSGILFRRVLET